MHSPLRESITDNLVAKFNDHAVSVCGVCVCFLMCLSLALCVLAACTPLCLEEWYPQTHVLGVRVHVGRSSGGTQEVHEEPRYVNAGGACVHEAAPDRFEAHAQMQGGLLRALSRSFARACGHGCFYSGCTYSSDVWR